MAASPARRPSSMSLLQDLMEHPLDPSYAAAADRRAAAGLPRTTGLRGPLVVVSALLVGFLFVVAALTLRPSGTTASREKEQLITQVTDRQAHGDAAAATVDALRAEITTYQQQALGSGSSVSDELKRLELLTGGVAATGPGLVLTVDDAPTAQQPGSGSDPRDADGFTEGRVTSFDLQILTNGLWQAGAEAIAVNGQRLTALSAIRFAGEAILVDYRPLSPPYVITAIGDPSGLQSRFAATAAGSYLKALTDNYAIPSTISAESSVQVSHASALDVTVATVPDTGIPTAPTAPTAPSTGQTTTTKPSPTPSASGRRTP